MTAASPESALVPAVGGTRNVPPPDPIAAEYLLLALRLDQHIPGLVDGYFGPAATKAQVDLESLRSPARLRDDAIALRERVGHEVADADRRSWLDAQLVALETQAAAMAGEPLPYGEHVARCMGFAPPRRADADFEVAAAEIDWLLPGTGPLDARLAAWDRELEVPVDRLPGVVDWLVAGFRARAADAFGLPAGEDLRVSLVRNQPWSSYDWFDGGGRSRVDLNIDLPIRAPDLIHTVARQTYPGHHLEHAWKEVELVDRLGRLEASVLLINTPECPISEGLADIGAGFASPLAERADLLVELFGRGGLAVAGDPVTARAVAERAVALTAPRRALGAILGEAAYRRHADGWSSEATHDYLVEVGRDTPAAAAKRLESIEHPLWRTYVFGYAEGEALLERWLAAASPRERTTRLARLLREQLTPASILAEVGRA